MTLHGSKVGTNQSPESEINARISNIQHKEANEVRDTADEGNEKAIKRCFRT
jgi:hypothetical protein